MPHRAKVINQRHHAKLRAQERYALTLNRNQYEQIVQLIQTGHGEFLGRESVNKIHFRLTYEERSLHLVFDQKRATIATFLAEGSKFTTRPDNQPPNWWLRARERREACPDGK